MSARLDVVHPGASRNTDILFAPCPASPEPCPNPNFLGPVNLNGLSACARFDKATRNGKDMREFFEVVAYLVVLPEADAP